MVWYREWLLVLSIIFIIRTIVVCADLNSWAYSRKSISLGLFFIAITSVVGCVFLAQRNDPYFLEKQEKDKIQRDTIIKLEAGAVYLKKFLNEVEARPYKTDELKTLIKNRVDKLNNKIAEEIEFMEDDIPDEPDYCPF